MAKDSTLVHTFLGDSIREFISLLVMEGILENQIETFLQVFRALGNQIKILFFLKKRNDLRGECEGQLVFLPRSLHGEKSIVCGLWHGRWLSSYLRRKFFPSHSGAKGMLMQFAKYLYLFDAILRNEVPVSNNILLYVLSNDCSAVWGDVIYNSSTLRCYSELCCVILYVCASPFPKKVAFQVLKAEYHW